MERSRRTPFWQAALPTPQLWCRLWANTSAVFSSSPHSVLKAFMTATATCSSVWLLQVFKRWCRKVSLVPLQLQVLQAGTMSMKVLLAVCSAVTSWEVVGPHLIALVAIPSAWCLCIGRLACCNQLNHTCMATINSSKGPEQLSRRTAVQLCHRPYARHAYARPSDHAACKLCLFAACPHLQPHSGPHESGAYQGHLRACDNAGTPQRGWLLRRCMPPGSG